MSPLNRRVFGGLLGLCAMAQGALQAQPYWFYEQFPANSAGKVNLMRFNLQTGVADVFLPDHEPAAGEIFWDESQSWIYYWIEANDHPQEGHVEVVSTRDPSLRRVLPDQPSLKFTLGVKFAPQLNRIYIASEKANYVYDGGTLARIDSFGLEQITVHESYFFSRDGSALYYRATDPARQQSSLTGFSLLSHRVVSRKAIAEIGPNVQTKVLYGGKNGRALFGYNDPGPGSVNGTFVVYDADLGIISPTVRFPYLSSDAQLSPDGSYLIIQESAWIGDHPDAAEPHQGSGRVWVFDVASGVLRQKFSYPPGGRVLVFDGFPDRLFYFDHARRQSFGGDLKTVVSVTDLLDSLQATLRVAATSRWIGSDSFFQVVSQHLTNASRMLSDGNESGCAAQLETFRKQVKSAFDAGTKPGDKRWVTMDGYKALYFNAGYVVDRLRMAKE